MFAALADAKDLGLAAGQVLPRYDRDTPRSLVLCENNQPLNQRLVVESGDADKLESDPVRERGLK